MSNHQLDPEMAKTHGIEKALILHYIQQQPFDEHVNFYTLVQAFNYIPFNELYVLIKQMHEAGLLSISIKRI